MTHQCKSSKLFTLRFFILSVYNENSNTRAIGRPRWGGSVWLPNLDQHCKFKFNYFHFNSLRHLVKSIYSSPSIYCSKLIRSDQLFYPASNNVNPIALRKAKIVCNFGLSECNRVKGKNQMEQLIIHLEKLMLQRPITIDIHLQWEAQKTDILDFPSKLRAFG